MLCIFPHTPKPATLTNSIFMLLLKPKFGSIARGGLTMKTIIVSALIALTFLTACAGTVTVTPAVRVTVTETRPEGYLSSDEKYAAAERMGKQFFLTRKDIFADWRMWACERAVARVYGARGWRCYAEHVNGVLILKVTTERRLQWLAAEWYRGRTVRVPFTLQPKGAFDLEAPLYMDENLQYFNRRMRERHYCHRLDDRRC